MSTDPGAEISYDLPVPEAFDDRAVRRAVRRGVLRSGLVSVSLVILISMVIYFVAAITVGLRSQAFHEVAFYGAQVGRPGYAVEGNSSSSSHGLSNTEGIYFVRRSAARPAESVEGRVVQGLTGGLRVDLPDPSGTPVGVAQSRGRPAKADSLAFLGLLPAEVATAAIVEFTVPADEAGLRELMGQLIDRGPYEQAVLLTDPYIGLPVSWPLPALADFPGWVGGLSEDDDRDLEALGSPPVEVLQAAAKASRIHAIVVEQTSVPELRTLLSDPRIRSVNVTEVAFDPARQNPGN